MKREQTVHPRSEILLVAHCRAHVRELLRTARILRDETSLSIAMYFGRGYDLVSADVRACQEAGIEILPESMRDRRDSPPQLSRFLCRKWLWRLPRLAKEIGGSVHQYFRMRRAQAAIRKLIEERGVSLVILPVENVGYETGLVVKAAHDVGVPSLVVPYTISDAIEPAEAYWERPRFQLGFGLNRLAARIYPHWRFEHKGRVLLRLPAPCIFAMEWAHVAPPAPWTLHSGFADLIAVESPHMLKHGLKSGLEANRMEVIGSPVDDILASGLKNRDTQRPALMSRLGLNPAHGLIVSALPPDQLVGIGRPDCEFCDYAELISFWVGSLAEVEDFSTVLCVHPRVDPADYLYLERENVRVARADTAEMIPLCDIYVASISATIRWAIACGIPTINYDVYRYRYRDYDEAGVLYVDSREAFREAIAGVTGNPTIYAELREEQHRCMTEWGLLDGKAKERIVAVVRRLSSRQREVS
ncbi:hypothetical protein ACFLR0_00545 [Candidatus Bipolaricaulota bacterium]